MFLLQGLWCAAAFLKEILLGIDQADIIAIPILGTFQQRLRKASVLIGLCYAAAILTPVMEKGMSGAIQSLGTQFALSWTVVSTDKL